MSVEYYRSRNSYAQIRWDMVGELDGDHAAAAIFDWIVWKSENSYDRHVDEEGREWVTAAVATLAKETESKPRTIRRVLTLLVERGYLDERKLGLKGPGDTTKSYAPIWAEQSADRLPKTANPFDEKQGCPIAENDKPSLYKNSLRTNAPSTPDEAFENFYMRYPRKVKKDAARRAWQKATKVPSNKREATIVAITEGLERYLAHWKTHGTEKQFIPYPASWLNAGSWADELDSENRENIPASYTKDKEFIPDDY